MGSLFSALDIARSGLFASRVQLDVAAHNIANANTEGYSRQRVYMDTFSPVRFPYGNLGRGVNVTSIQRVRDSFLDVIYRQQVSGLGTAEIQAQYYQLLEDAYLEPTDSGLGTRLNVFFDAMNDLANNVEDFAVREVAVSEALAIAETLNDLYGRVDLLRTNANEDVRNLVPQINALTQSIADVNRLIRNAELDNSKANDLRDTRDRALDELATLVNISTTEREDGQITVRIGPDVVVDERGARALEVALNPGMDDRRGDLIAVRFADTGQDVRVKDGELFAALHMRDVVIPSFMDRNDTMTASLIEQVNRIHSQANGLINRTGTIRSTNPVEAPGTALSDAGLPFAVNAGSFQIAIYDDIGEQVGGSPFTIDVDPDDTLSDLIMRLNATITDPAFSASMNPNNTFSMGVADGYSFGFANDTSGVLTALGINGLFTGRNAQTIGVNQDILDDPGLLASGYSLDPEATGDNRAALALADVRNAATLDGNSSTINDYYESTVAKLGVEARYNQVKLQTETAFTQDYDQRRQRIHGVSIDEEVTFMLSYQRAFEASARVVTTVDRMLETLFNMAL